MPYLVVYIDPEARPSPDVVAHFQERGMDIKWICDYRELDPRRYTIQFHAVIVDMTSSDPKDFPLRIQEARSLNLAVPSIAIVPPLAGDSMGALKNGGFIHHWFERPIDQDDLVRDTLDLIKKFEEEYPAQGDDVSAERTGTEAGDFDFGLAEAFVSKPMMGTSDLFADILDHPDTDDGEVPHFRHDSFSKPAVAHEYRSMRADVVDSGLSALGEKMQNYVLEEHVATGGMAELFKARLRGAEGFTRTVAIKRILPMRCDDEDFVAMFIDEARLASSLDHPNIIRTLDFGKCKTAAGVDTYFIALDFVEGKDLNWVIKRVKERGYCIPEPIICYIAAKMACALQYLHTRTFDNGDPMGLVHRDISPHNIMVSKQGGVVIVDFGVVKANLKVNLTMDGNLKGKLVYMSPEQAMGSNLDGRSDLFSLGLVIQEALTTRRAYLKGKPGAKAELQILKMAQNGAVPPLKEGNPFVTDGIQAIVAKACQKKASHRYSDAQAMEKALKAHLRSLPERVEESDLAEFVVAVLDKDPDVLKTLIETRYPATQQFAALHAQDAAAGVAETSGAGAQMVPLPAPVDPKKERKAKKGDTAFLWLAGFLLGFLVLAFAAMRVAQHLKH